jgi:hypothetical protein
VVRDVAVSKKDEILSPVRGISEDFVPTSHDIRGGGEKGLESQ